MRLRRITLSLIGFALCAAAEPETYPTATWEQVQHEETRWAQEGKVEAPTPPGSQPVPTTAALVLNGLDRSTVRPIPCQDDSTG